MELRRSMTTLTGIHWSNDRPFVIKGDSIFTPSRAGSEGIRVIPSSTSPAIFGDSSYASEDIMYFIWQINIGDQERQRQQPSRFWLTAIARIRLTSFGWFADADCEFIVCIKMS